MSKMISFKYYLTELFRETFVRFFFGHPLIRLSLNHENCIVHILELIRLKNFTKDFGILLVVLIKRKQQQHYFVSK